MRKHTKFVAAIVTAAVLFAVGVGSRSDSVGAVAKLDRSDWVNLCADANYDVGQPYQAAELVDFNCREFSVRADSRLRRFVATVPQAVLDSGSPTPVVFMFHGTTGTGEQYWSISKWRELAVQQDFIAVFPSALEYELSDNGKTSSKWHGFNLPCEVDDPSELADDVAFVDAVVDDLRSQLIVDDERIYAAGFSSGGGMAQRLAVDRTDTFAAVGAWAGSFGDCQIDPITPPTEPIPVWFGVGSEDDRWHAIGAVNEVPHDLVGIVGAYADQLNQWMPAFSLDVGRGSATEQPLSVLATEPPLIDASVVPQWGPAVVWETPTGANNSGNAFYWTTLRDTTHHYPNAWPGAKRQTRISQGVSMAVMHWQFFLDHPK